MDIQKLGLIDASTMAIRKLLCLNDPLDVETSLDVMQISQGRYGIFVGTVLISIHTDQATAEDRRRLLLNH